MDSYNRTIYILGGFLGPEDLYNEYKELCLSNIHLYFSYDEIYFFTKYNIFIDKNKWNLMIDDILIEYMKKYIPKYIGNFSKAEINGNLYIGVDDTGYIEGIPYFGELDTTKIREYIFLTINYARGINEKYKYDSDTVLWYYNNLDIKIYKLDTKFENKKKIYDLSIEHLNILENHNKIIEDKWNNYKKKYDEWLYNLTKYSGKLISYLIEDDMRLNLINFVINDFKNNKLYDQNKLKDILEFYNQDKKEFEKIVFSIDEIEKVIKDQYSPIGYIMKFKDFIIEQIRELKPINPITKPDKFLYYRFANKISNIRAHLQNLDVNFYLIKITIPYKLNTYIEYYLPNSKIWICKSRTIIANGPDAGSPSCL